MNNLPCKECGATCCKWGSGVHLEPQEYFDFLAMLGSKGMKNIYYQMSGVGNKVQCGIIFENRRCQFLDENDRCSIYDKRPQMCRTYNCRNVLALKRPDYTPAILRENPHLEKLLEEENE